MDIILKGHRGKMEVVVGGMGRGGQGGWGVSEGAGNGEMSLEPRPRCRVRCGGSCAASISSWIQSDGGGWKDGEKQRGGD